MKKYSRKNLSGWFIAAFLLSLLIILPIGRGGFWESDDGEWMVIRFSAFHESLRDGHFPVRWTQRLNHHYGYPVFNFLYPLPFYLAEIAKIVGFGFVESIETVFGGSVVLAAVGMYLFARKWGEIPGFLASVLYVFAPYRVFLLYTRGSLGESVALAAAPFVFWFADRLFKDPKWKNIAGMGVSYAALITSHNVMAVLFTPILILYMLKESGGKLSTLRPSLYALFIGLALSAFFWIPALWELQFTKARELRISDYPSYFLDASGIISMLGIVQLAFVILAVLLRRWFFAVTALVATGFMHPGSSFLISALPIIEKIQFPWRLAAVFMFASAASAGISIKDVKLKRTHKKAMTILVVIVAIVMTVPAIANVRFVDRPEAFYTTNDATTTVKNEFTPIWVSQEPKEKPEGPYRIATTQGTYEILGEDIRTGKYVIQIRLNEPATIIFNTHYFPGWKLYVDDERIELDPTQTGGLLQAVVNPGMDKLRDIKVLFEKTPVRKTADAISATSLLIVFALLIFKGLPRASWRKRVGLLSLLLAAASTGFFVFSNLHTYRQVFDPQSSEEAYQNSQWVNPDAGTNVPIGDHGLYGWAGWAYMHGENPILVNPEMPPLGKYIIGVGLMLVKRPAIVGFILASFAVITLCFLARELLKDGWLAVTATSLFTLEPVMRNLANITMLDGLQVGWLNLVFLFFLKGLRNSKWFVVSSLALGAMASTKFYAGVASVILALTLFLVLSRKWKKLRSFILSLPLVGLVHAGSYTSFFTHGGSLRGYLGTQKWILDFYRQGNVGTIPSGSYWLLVLFNRWRIWFGQEWGVFTTVSSDLWRVSWPVNVIASVVTAILLLRKRMPERFGIIIVWLGVYSVFLTFIIGWPHYMLLFLPYSYILVVELARQIVPIIPEVSREFHLGGGKIKTPRDTRARRK